MSASRFPLTSVESIRAREALWADLTEQAIGFFQEGRYAEAVRAAEEALEVARGIYDSHHLNMATSLSNLAVLYRTAGRERDAQDLFREAFDIDDGARPRGFPLGNVARA
jgi:Tfp pilus assembly protein PilF